MDLEGVGEESRKPSQPWSLSRQQGWAGELVEASHTEALWAFGEFALFTLMWRPEDETKGLVQRCPECYVGSRSAQAFKQPERKKCPNCYGSTFDGGFRAQIVRPAIFKDRNQEAVDTDKGTTTLDTLMVETTSDFYLHKGDYVFRADGSRLQTEEKSEDVVRTGFEAPHGYDSFSGHISGCHLEDPTSIAYTIPPSPAALVDLLDIPRSHYVPDLSALETIRPNGYLR